MRLSILGFYITIERSKNAAPLAVDQFGHSFAFTPLGELAPAAWWLVDCQGDEYELPISSLRQSTDGVIYYPADSDLFEYLSGEGHDLTTGEYYYKVSVGTGDQIYRSDIFKVKRYIESQAAGRAFSSGFSNGFS